MAFKMAYVSICYIELHIYFLYQASGVRRRRPAALHRVENRHVRELLSGMRKTAREVMEGTFCIQNILFKMGYVSILDIDG